MPSLKPCLSASRCAAARSTRACHAAVFDTTMSAWADTSLMRAPRRGGSARLGWAFYPAQAGKLNLRRLRRIRLERAHQAARQFLLVGGLLQQAFFSRVRQTAEFDKGGWDIRRGQHG